MASYNHDIPYYPPLQNVVDVNGEPPSNSYQQQQWQTCYTTAPHPPASNQYFPHNPLHEQIFVEDPGQLGPYASESQKYDQKPSKSISQRYDQRPSTSARPQEQYQNVAQIQQPVHFASPPSPPMARASPDPRDAYGINHNSLHAPGHDRRHSSGSTHSHHSTRSHRSSRSAGRRSSHSRNSSSSSSSSRYYVTKDGELIDVAGLDKKPSYGDSVILVWNGLKGIWSRTKA